MPVPPDLRKDNENDATRISIAALRNRAKRKPIALTQPNPKRLRAGTEPQKAAFLPPVQAMAVNNNLQEGWGNPGPGETFTPDYVFGSTQSSGHPILDHMSGEEETFTANGFFEEGLPNPRLGQSEGGRASPTVEEMIGYFLS